MIYKLNRKNAFGECTSVILTAENIIKTIPFDPANTDYQAYLAWLEEGNVPEPADE